MIARAKKAVGELALCYCFEPDKFSVFHNSEYVQARCYLGRSSPSWTAAALMPKEATSKAPNRWEGTHTYSRNPPKKRTVAQIREEAAARIKVDREKRRIGVENLRRNSIAAFPTGSGGAENSEEGEQEEVQIEEVFFDANGEEMPGSHKKKKCNSGGQSAEEMDQSEGVPRQAGVDPAMLELLMNIKKDINDNTKSAVDKVDKRIDENSKAIEKVGNDTANEMRKLRQHCEEAQALFEKKIEKKIEERDATLERRLVAIEARAQNTGIKTSTVSPTVKLRRDEAYAKARRTLKIWPVAGNDLEDLVKAFLEDKLKIDDQRIRSMGRIEVKLPIGKSARDRSEVLATFETREDRDFVKSMGVNLATLKGVGVSIHVPGHLLDNYYALSSIGYNIRQNQEGVKRSIKYDDSVQDLILDIFIGGKWRRIHPGEARAALKASPAAVGASNSGSISSEDLIGLVSGQAIPGLTAVEVPADDETTNSRGSQRE